MSSLELLGRTQQWEPRGPRPHAGTRNCLAVDNEFFFSPFPEEKPKPDPVLKPPSPVLRPEPAGEKKDQAGQTAEVPTSVETPAELPRAPSPAPAAPVPPVPVAAMAVTVSSKALPAAEPEDKCELASPREEAMPPRSATPCPEPAAPPAAGEPGAEVCPEPSSAVASPSDAAVTVTVTAGPGGTDDTSGVRDAGPAAEPEAEVAQAEAAALTVELEPPEASPAEGESSSPPSAAHAAPSPPPTPPPTPPPPSPPVSLAAVTTTTPSPPPLPSPSALPVVQGDLEGEESTRTTLSEEVEDTEKKEETEADGQLEESREALSVNSSKSPVPGKRWALWVLVNCRMKERGFFFFQQMFLFLSAKEKSLVVHVAAVIVKC